MFSGCGRKLGDTQTGTRRRGKLHIQKPKAKITPHMYYMCFNSWPGDPISSAPVNCLDQADAAGLASHDERWDLVRSKTIWLFSQCQSVRDRTSICNAAIVGTIACCYTTISGHTVIYSYIILSQQQSKIYPPSNRKCLLDRKQDCQGWVKGGETLIQLPAKVRRGGPHGRVCFYFQLCGSLLHNINCAPPPPHLCHVCCLYDDKFSAVVTLVTLSEDWWSSEAGNPSPLHRDFRNLFLITPHGRGRVVMTPSQHDTTGNRYWALKVNVLLENYLSSDECRSCLCMRQSTDGSASSAGRS